MSVTLSNLSQMVLHAACCVGIGVSATRETMSLMGLSLVVLSINAFYCGLRNGVQIGWEARQR